LVKPPSTALNGLDNRGEIVATLKDAYTNSGRSEPGVRGEKLIEYRVADRAELLAADWVPLLPGEERIAVELPRSPAFVSLSELVGEDGIIQGIRFEGSSDTVNVKNTIVSRKRDVGSRLNWLITGEDSEFVLAQSQTTGAEVRIPIAAVEPAMRTPAGQTKMLISPPPDYAVRSRFPGDESFWDDPAPDEILLRRLDHLRSREGRVLLAGRNHVNFLSEGTHHLAFTAGGPIVPTWSFWSLKIEDQDVANALCLWLNSSFAFTHLFDKRIIGTGVYVGWLKSDLIDLLVPDLRNLAPAQRTQLRALFEKLAATDWEPLLAQYKLPSERRVELDTTLAKILGLKKWESRESLSPVYTAIVSKLETLRDVESG